MKWTTRQFGEIDYAEEDVLTFPEGLVGFEACRRYVLVNDEDSRPFYWLVSLDDPDLSLPLIEPELVAAGYAGIIGVAEGATVLAVAALRRDPAASTVNLRSPIILDNRTRTGRQTILENDRFPLHHPLIPATASLAKG